jgi:hypothetical protein
MPEQLKKEAIAGLESVNGIRRRCSELSSTLFDLLLAAQKLDASAALGAIPVNKRLSAVRSLVETGALASHRQFLLAFVDRMVGLSPQLDAIVYGFLEVRDVRSREVSFRFELGKARLAFNATELARLGETLDAIAQSAVPRLQFISKEMECKPV